MKAKLQLYMKEHGLSQSETAKRLGFSGAAVSQYLSGKYPNPETIDAKVVVLLEKEATRERVAGMQDIPFAMTSIAEKVIGALEYARAKRNITLIYGDAGVGKTKSTDEWRRGKSDVVKLTASPALGNPKSFFKYLARELKVNKSGHIDDLYLELCDRLTGSDKMLVIDEAQHLKLQTLENLRGIQETAGIAVVLIGNEVVHTKMIGRHSAEFAQLFSRLGWKRHVLTDHFTGDDMHRVFGRNLAPEVTSLLLDICHSKYGLRGAANVYINASNNEDTSVRGIKAIAREMGVLA